MRKQIELACQASGRKKENVKLLLATQTVSLETFKIAIKAGKTYLEKIKIKNFGGEFPLMQQYNQVKWHFIGHLQTNKVKHVIKYVTLIHSVDRLKLGQAFTSSTCQRKQDNGY